MFSKHSEHDIHTLNLEVKADYQLQIGAREIAEKIFLIRSLDERG